jgi:hypothetical protein
MKLSNLPEFGSSDSCRTGPVDTIFNVTSLAKRQDSVFPSTPLTGGDVTSRSLPAHFRFAYKVD